MPESKAERNGRLLKAADGQQLDANAAWMLARELSARQLYVISACNDNDNTFFEWFLCNKQAIMTKLDHQRQEEQNKHLYRFIVIERASVEGQDKHDLRLSELWHVGIEPAGYWDDEMTPILTWDMLKERAVNRKKSSFDHMRERNAKMALVNGMNYRELRTYAKECGLVSKVGMKAEQIRSMILKHLREQND